MRSNFLPMGPLRELWDAQNDSECIWVCVMTVDTMPRWSLSGIILNTIRKHNPQGGSQDVRLHQDWDVRGLQEDCRWSDDQVIRSGGGTMYDGRDNWSRA